MIRIDNDLFCVDPNCIVSRVVYKHNHGILCASTLFATGFNAWDMVGVYFLFYRKELVYIGKSDTHIGSRINSHHREDRFDFDAFFIKRSVKPTHRNVGGM